jgi:hypothetical protein
MSAPTPQSLEKLLAQALRAREQQPAGGGPASPQYAHLLTQLRFGADGTLRRMLEALTRCVALVAHAHVAHDELLHAALALAFRAVPAGDVARLCEAQAEAARVAAAAAPGAALPPPAAMCTLGTAEAQAAFAVALVEANPHLLRPVAVALLKALRRSQEASDGYAALRAAELAGGGGGGGALPPAALPADVAAEAAGLLSGYYRVVYAAFGEVLQRVPLAAGELHRALVEGVPASIAPPPLQLAYARHLLQLASRLPPLRDRLFAVLVERAVELDVAVPLELLPEGEGEGEGEGGEESEDGAA